MAFITPSITAPSLTTRLPSRNPTRPSSRLPTVQSRRPLRMTSTAPATIDTAWPAFAAKMKESNVVPPLEEWHALIDQCVAARDPVSKIVWVLSVMRETGLVPTAVTYEKVLMLCIFNEDREAAFLLVELMFHDKVLLGDVQLPEGLEPVLRKILPPDAFE